MTTLAPALWIWRKSFCHRKCGLLICFESYLLSKHNIARHEVAFWDETVATEGPANFIQLFNVCCSSIVNPIPLVSVAADDVEKVECIKLRQLLGGKPSA